MEGGRAAVAGCSIGAVVRSRRMSRAVGALWAAVVGAGLRGYAAMGGLSLDARGCSDAWIGIGEAFVVQYFLVAAGVNVGQHQSCTAESLIPYWVVRVRAVEILRSHHTPVEQTLIVKKK